MKTYVYYFKSNSNQEVIGRVPANNQQEAHDMVASIKRLELDAVVNLFEIKQVCSNGDFI